MPGIIPARDLKRAHALQHPVARQQVVERELALAASAPRAARCSSSAAASSAFSISVSTSPMPRIRDAIRSGWKYSSWSSFSPSEISLIGRPVTAFTESAAPPRASPSSLVRIDAVERDPLLERLGDGDGLLAGHRVEHEQHVRRLDGVADGDELVHQRLVDVQAPGGVDDDDVAALVARPLDAGRRDGNGVVALAAVDRDLDLLAELLELLDRRRALQVGRRRAPASCPPCAGAAPALPRRSSCPEPWSPAIRITVGGRPANASRESPVPISSVSSSWTIFTTCWPGFRSFSTSSPSARSRTRATKSLTTRKLTSASSSARRISRMAREIDSSSSRFLPLRSPRAALSLSESVSNTVEQV